MKDEIEIDVFIAPINDYIKEKPTGNLRGDWQKASYPECYVFYHGNNLLEKKFMRWFHAELIHEKNKQQTKLFRHQFIMIYCDNDMDSDVSYTSNTVTVDETAPLFVKEKCKIGDKTDIMAMKLYSEIANRNPIFLRESFSMNAHGWDEIADLL